MRRRPSSGAPRAPRARSVWSLVGTDSRPSWPLRPPARPGGRRPSPGRSGSRVRTGSPRRRSVDRHGRMPVERRHVCPHRAQGRATAPSVSSRGWRRRRAPSRRDPGPPARRGAASRYPSSRNRALDRVAGAIHDLHREGRAWGGRGSNPGSTWNRGVHQRPRARGPSLECRSSRRSELGETGRGGPRYRGSAAGPRASCARLRSPPGEASDGRSTCPRERSLLGVSVQVAPDLHRRSHASRIGSRPAPVSTSVASSAAAAATVRCTVPRPPSGE